jgi:hypothetical protein
MHQLVNIYANGNKLKEVSSDLCLLPNLKQLNLANNSLTALPGAWTDMWGELDATAGTFGDVKDKSKCFVVVTGNPLGSASALP